MKLMTLAILSLLSLSAFSAGDAAKGAKVFKKVNCALCHNKDGMGKAKDEASIAILKAPRIAGLSEEYIVAQVTAIQKKERKTKNTSMMYSKVRKLSAEDIANVAAYVHSLSKEAYKGMKEK